MYRLATIHFVTDRWTDRQTDDIFTIADHTAARSGDRLKRMSSSWTTGITCMCPSSYRIELTVLCSMNVSILEENTQG